MSNIDTEQMVKDAERLGYTDPDQYIRKQIMEAQKEYRKEDPTAFTSAGKTWHDMSPSEKRRFSEVSKKTYDRVRKEEEQRYAEHHKDTPPAPPDEVTPEPEDKTEPEKTLRGRARDRFYSLFDFFKKRPDPTTVHPEDPIHIVVDKDEPDQAKAVADVIRDVHYTDVGYEREVEDIRQEIAEQEQEIKKAEMFMQDYSIQMRDIDREIQNVQAQPEGTKYVSPDGKEFTKSQYISKLRGYKKQYQKAYDNTVKFKREARGNIDKMHEGKRAFIQSVQDYGRQLRERIVYASPDRIMLLETPTKTEADIEREEKVDTITRAYEKKQDVISGFRDLTRPDLTKPLSPTDVIKGLVAPKTRGVEVGLQLFGGTLLDPLHVYQETEDIHLAVGSVIGPRFKDPLGVIRDPRKRAELFTDAIVDFKMARTPTEFDLESGEFGLMGGRGWRVGEKGRLETVDLTYEEMTPFERITGEVGRVSGKTMDTPLGKTILRLPVATASGYLIGSSVATTKAYTLGRFGEGAWQLKALSGAGLAFKAGAVGYFAKTKFDIYSEHGVDAMKLSISEDLPVMLALGYGYKVGTRVPTSEAYYKGVSKRQLEIREQLKGDVIQFGDEGAMGITGKVEIVSPKKGIPKTLYEKVGVQEVRYKVGDDLMVDYFAKSQIGDPSARVFVKGHKHPFQYTPRTLHPTQPTVDLLNIKIKPTNVYVEPLTEFTFKPSALTKTYFGAGKFVGDTPPAQTDVFTGFMGKDKFMFPAQKVSVIGREVVFTSPTKPAPMWKTERIYDIRGWGIHKGAVPSKSTMEFVSGKGWRVWGGGTPAQIKTGAGQVTKQVVMPTKAIDTFTKQLRADTFTGFTQKEMATLRFKPQTVALGTKVKQKVRQDFEFTPSIDVKTMSKIGTKQIQRTDVDKIVATVQASDIMKATKVGLKSKPAQKVVQVQMPSLKIAPVTKITQPPHKPIMPIPFKFAPLPPAKGVFTPVSHTPKRRAPSKERAVKKPRRTTPRYGYTPSLTAIMYGITAPSKKLKRRKWWTGLELRPMLLPKPKKRKAVGINKKGKRR